MITIYVLKNGACPKCHQAELLLNACKVEYQKKFVEDNMDFIREKNLMEAPILCFDNGVIKTGSISLKDIKKNVE